MKKPDFDCNPDFGEGRTAFVTSPVRKANEIPGLVDFLKAYKNGLEKGFGYEKVHVPLFDTPQDREGFKRLGCDVGRNFNLSKEITDFNSDAMIDSLENHFYYIDFSESSGSLHDLGNYDMLLRIHERIKDANLSGFLAYSGLDLGKKFFMINPPKPDSKKDKSYAHLVLGRAKENPVEGEEVLRDFANMLLGKYNL